MAEMEHLIDDAILAEFAVIGTPAQCRRALCERFAPVVNRMTPTSMRRAPVVDAGGHQN